MTGDEVEVGGDARGDLRRCGHPTDHPGRGLEARVRARQRPAAGQQRIRESDERDGVAPGGLVRREVVGLHQGGFGGQSADLHRTVGQAEDRPRGEDPVVQAAGPGALQGGGRLADDAAGLLGGQAAVGQDRGDRAGAVERLLDDERRGVVAADVEDANQPRLVHPGGAPGGVEGRGGDGTVGVEAQQDHLAVQRLVRSHPPFVAGVLRDPSLDEVPPAEQRAWSDALHTSPAAVRHPHRHRTDPRGGPSGSGPVVRHPTGPRVGHRCRRGRGGVVGNQGGRRDHRARGPAAVRERRRVRTMPKTRISATIAPPTM